MAMTLILGEKDEETFLAKVAKDLDRQLTDDEAKYAGYLRSLGYSVGYVWWRIAKHPLPQHGESK